MDEFLSNPLLNETRFVTANCLVKSIEVDGSVFIQGVVNDIHIDNILADVVYKHEPETRVNAFKSFRNLSAPNIIVPSGLIEDIPLNDFVTQDTEQTFKITKIHGYCYFSNLRLGGLFNFINVTELERDSIKLFGEQYTEATLIFQRDNLPIGIVADELQIIESINDLPVTEFIGIDENLELFETILFNSILANECKIGGNVIGSVEPATVNGWPLKILNEAHLSRNKTQIVDAPFHVRSAIIRGKFDANIVNGYDFQQALVNLMQRKTNEELLAADKVDIGELRVNGSIKFRHINGFDFDEIKSNAIWLNRPNVVTVPLTFSDQVSVYGNVSLSHLNNVHFSSFADDLVRKSHKKPIIFGTTVFRSNVIVSSRIDATQVNNFPTSDILTKGFNRPIGNPINVYGEIVIGDLQVDGQLNGITGERISTSYRFDESQQCHIFTGNVVFNESVKINSMMLDGGFNDVTNVKHHLNSLVRKDRPNIVVGRKTFTADVHFDNDIQLQQFNKIDVKQFLDDVILIDQSETIDIRSPVIFENSVNFTRLNVNGELKVLMVSNRSISEMYQNGIRTDKPFVFNQTVIFGDGTLKAGNILLSFLNDQPVQNILTLTTIQNFTGNLSFDSIAASIPIVVTGLVNDADLQSERKNTLMVSENRFCLFSVKISNCLIYFMLFFPFHRMMVTKKSHYEPYFHQFVYYVIYGPSIQSITKI